MEKIIEQAYQKSIEVLKQNSSKHGIVASAKTSKSKKRNYDSIFGRDASICVLGMTISGDKKLKNISKKSIFTLAKSQADNGQIPFYTNPEKKETWFYYLGSIDSTLWWLLAIKMYEKNTGENISQKLDKQIIKALNWLYCQEHPNFFLLLQNETTDWADLMPRHGYVLYSNALWYWLKKEYKISTARKTKKYFTLIFDPHVNIPKNEKHQKRIKALKNNISVEKKNPTLSSYVSYMNTGNDIDIFANILACQSGAISKKRQIDIMNYLLQKNANAPWPVKTVLKPIKQNSKDWQSYMNKHLCINKPWQYHNGGIWPYIGGFWVLFVASIDKNLAKKELLKLAELNKKNNWQFNEWFHGNTGRAMGMPCQSWNAAMYILAYKYLYK